MWAVVKDRNGKLYSFELPPDQYQKPGFESFFRQMIARDYGIRMAGYRLTSKSEIDRMLDRDPDAAVDMSTGAFQEHYPLWVWWNSGEDDDQPELAGVNRWSNWQGQQEQRDRNRSQGRTRPPNQPSGRMSQMQRQLRQGIPPHVDARPGRPQYGIPAHQGNWIYSPLLDASNQGYGKTQGHAWRHMMPR